MDATSPAEPVMKAISQAKNRTTTVLQAVARVESVFLIPHFARIEVSAEKNADPKANTRYISSCSDPVAGTPDSLYQLGMCRIGFYLFPDAVDVHCHSGTVTG